MKQIVRSIAKVIVGILFISTFVVINACDKKIAVENIAGNLTAEQMKLIACNAFDVAGLNPNSSANGLNSNYGIIAELFSFEHREPSFSHRFIKDDDNESEMVPISLYFCDINISTRPHKGFLNLLGEQIRKRNGEILKDRFALEMKSRVSLSVNDLPGDYQFALISNGANLSLTNEADGPFSLIENYNNNGRSNYYESSDDFFTSARMACANSPVHFEIGTLIPINLKYYQREHENASLVLMWRPWPKDASQVLDPECNKRQRSKFYIFDEHDKVSKPTNMFNKLADRGWKILSPENYFLPAGAQNQCTQAPTPIPEPAPVPPVQVPAPVIPNASIAVASVTNSTATINWSTDIPATSQIEYTNMVTGVVLTTPADGLLTTTHTVLLSGLNPTTLYAVIVISASSSGQTTRGAAISFRTPN